MKKTLKSKLSGIENTLRKKYKIDTKSERLNKKGCIIYTRVSSLEQKENNSSLKIQLKVCKEYALKQGLIVLKEFGGTNESAKTDDRKEFINMIEFAKKNKEVRYILVYNYDRFSRTGPKANVISENLNKKGIILKSVTQEIDNSTANGKLQESIFHIFNNYDNNQRSLRTSNNTREILLKGYWPYHTPMGYKNLKPKHRACDHHYVITEEGKLIRQAFIWKSEGTMTNQEIISKLSKRGLNLNEKNFRWILSNVFYAGYVTGRLIDGSLVKGRHPALVNEKVFMKANNLLNKAINVVIEKKGI